jgi:hypothetical protein
MYNDLVNRLYKTYGIVLDLQRMKYIHYDFSTTYYFTGRNRLELFDSLKKTIRKIKKERE